MAELKDYQLRVIQEGEELKIKMEALGRFMLTEPFDELPIEEQVDLKSQLRVMIEYLNILTRRILRFKKL